MTQDRIELIFAAIGASGLLASAVAVLLPQGWRLTQLLIWWGSNVRRLPTKKVTP